MGNKKVAYAAFFVLYSIWVQKSFEKARITLFKKLYLIIYTFGKQLQRDNIGAYASSIAFFFLLSMIPILSIAGIILLHSPVTEPEIIYILEEYSPDFLNIYIEDFVPQIYESSGTVLPIAIVTLLWSAGKGMWGLMMGLNTANEVKEKRNAILVRLIASFYSMIMIVVLIICMGMVILGETVVGKLKVFFPNVTVYLQMLGNLRFIVVWGMLTLLFVLLYTFVPNKKMKMRLQIPGAVFSAVGWSVLSWGFSMYLNYFAGSVSLYGSLTTIIITMFWLYGIMYILLMGANLNRYFKSAIEPFMKRKKADK